MPRSALDLAYAPPFSPVRDPILIAALQASAAVRAAPERREAPDPGAWCRDTGSGAVGGMG